MVAIDVFLPRDMVIDHLGLPGTIEVKSFTQTLQDYGKFRLELTASGDLRFVTRLTSLTSTVLALRGWLEAKPDLKTMHEDGHVFRTRLIGEITVHRLVQLNKFAAKAACVPVRKASYGTDWTV